MCTLHFSAITELFAILHHLSLNLAGTHLKLRKDGNLVQNGFKDRGSSQNAAVLINANADPSIPQFIHNLLDLEFASGGRPGSVAVAGHSQGAALALYASVTYSRRSWDG